MEIIWFVGFVVAAVFLGLISLLSASVGVFCAQSRPRRAPLIGAMCGTLPALIFAAAGAALAFQSNERFLGHGPPIGPPIAMMLGLAGLVSMIAGGAFGRWLGARRIVYNSSRSLCVNCGYDLNGLTERRGPECGWRF